MSDPVLSVSVSGLTSRLKLLNELRVEDNKAFFDAVEAALEAAKALLASTEKALCVVEDRKNLSNASTPEPMDMSLSDVSANTSGVCSAETSALIEELDKASENVKLVLASADSSFVEESKPEVQVAVEKSSDADD